MDYLLMLRDDTTGQVEFYDATAIFMRPTGIVKMDESELTYGREVRVGVPGHPRTFLGRLRTIVDSV